jgi:hypothetical protein
MLKTSSYGNGQGALDGLEKRLTGRVPDDADIPRPLRRAVRFMLAGAAVTLVTGTFYVIAVLIDPTRFNSGKPMSSGMLGRALVYYIITTLVYIALWIVMARTNRRGQRWARIVATVLFAIATFDLYAGVNGLQSGQTIDVVNVVSFVLSVAEWACGLGAIATMWRSEATVYYKSNGASGAFR